MENNNYFIEVDGAYSKDEFLGFISEYLRDNKKITSKNLFLLAIQERERVGSTLIEENFSVPHVEDASIIESMVFLVRMKTPIQNWSENYPVDTLLFVLIRPKEGRKTMKKIKKQIQKLAYDETIDVLKFGTKEQVESYFIDEEVE
ncbi:MAG: PTS sugar transporter subunit IIA [Enterococcus sp.]